MPSGEHACPAGVDEARESAGVDSRFDVFLDAAKELDRRGKTTDEKDQNLTGEGAMTEKERKRLEATRAKNRRVGVHFCRPLEVSFFHAALIIFAGSEEI